uniref:Uncharacterized protein n=1 Tax=Glossina brevipalpis TaxID=37001 RepID=A0A1A9WYH2_9MUSC
MIKVNSIVAKLSIKGPTLAHISNSLSLHNPSNSYESSNGFWAITALNEHNICRSCSFMQYIHVDIVIVEIMEIQVVYRFMVMSIKCLQSADRCFDKLLLGLVDFLIYLKESTILVRLVFHR